MGEKWRGGDMDYPGGGFKVNLLKKEISNIVEGKDDSVKDVDNLVVMFTDSYDVVLAAGKDKILKTFRDEFPGKKVVFGAEDFCWPRRDLAEDYPEVDFLNLPFIVFRE